MAPTAGSFDVQLLRVATAGSVDDGKSTLVGRLLLDTGSVFADQFDAVTTGDSIDLALLTDGLRAEREQGITIDVAYRYFSTVNRRFVLADTPGHVQYNRNSISGMSTADAAVVLVDVRRSMQDQARRHLATAAMLRVPHVVVAVNKMDAIDYHADGFHQVTEEVLACAEQLGIESVVIIPISALTGDNVVRRTSAMNWYRGAALLEHLEQIPVTQTHSEAGSARLFVQCVLKEEREGGDISRSYAGRLASGPLMPGDEVVVLPTGTVTRISFVRSLGDPVDEAFPGDSIEVGLTDHVDVARGDLIARPTVPTVTTTFTAVVCMVADRTVRPGDPLLIKHGTRTVRAVLHELSSSLNLSSMRHAPGNGEATQNDIAVVSIRTAEPLPVEDYSLDRETGSFLLLDPDDGATLAAGMVIAEAARPLTRQADGTRPR